LSPSILTLPLCLLLLPPPAVCVCVSVPWQYYHPTMGVEGVRVDRDQRPELCLGSYEMIHPNKVTLKLPGVTIQFVCVCVCVIASVCVCVCVCENLPVKLS